MGGPIAGAALALAFAVVLSAALWKLRGLRGTVGSARACRSPVDGPVILVQVVQGDDLKLVESACRLAQEQHGEIVLVYVIESPQRLRRGAMVKQAEEDASAALAAPRGIVLQWGVPVRTVIWRDRVMLHGIAAAASCYHAHVILSYPPSRSTRGDPEARGQADS